MKSCNFKLAAFLFLDISKQFRRRVQQMRVQRVKFLFQPPGFFQDFRFPERKESALRVPNVGHELNVFPGLFGRYFFQILDLRAFRRFHKVFIHFSFSFALRASFWPCRVWPFFVAVLFSFWGAIFLAPYSGRIRNRPCTKRTFPFRSGNSVRTTGNPGNQSLQVFQTDTEL